MKPALMCLLILGMASFAGASPEQDDSLGLMILRLEEANGVFMPDASRAQEFVKAVLGENTGMQHPHVVGLMGVRGAQELEELIWPLNRALGPNDASYVTWITGDGPEGRKPAILSLFPLAGFQDLFEPGLGTRIFYCMLDAPGGLLHVILADEVSRTGKGSGIGISVQRAAARLAGIILKQDPEARLLIMGAFEPESFLQTLKDRESFGWVSCPWVSQGFPVVVMVHPFQPGPGKAAVEVQGTQPGSCAVKLQWVLRTN